MTGEGLLRLLGFDNYSDAAAAGFTDPSIFGLTDWRDYLSPDTFKWDNKWLNTKGVSPELKYAIENGLYDPGQLFLNEDNAPWFEPTAGTGMYNWIDFKGSGKNGRKYDGNDIVGKEEFKKLQDAFPNTLGGLEYYDGITLGEIHKAMRNSDDWIATQNYLRDPNKGAERRAAYMAEVVKNNLDKKTGRPSKDFAPTKIYDFIPVGGGKFKVIRKKEVSEADELKFWDAVQDDQKYGDMYNTYHVPKSKTRYFVADGKGGYKEYFTEPKGLTQVGSDLSSYIRGENEPADKITGQGYNQTIKFYQAADESKNDETKDKDKTKYLKTAWNPKTDWTSYALGLTPGLTGLGMMLAQGKPDVSGLQAAADAYASNLGIMAPVHLTHGLMKPAIVDPRNTHNMLTASRLGTNRILRNTGSAPSQAATILANDMNYQQQMGQNDLRDWLANREQEQKAATFNEGVARANAQFLNQGDQFNAQMLANTGERYAQLKYNAEKEKLDQENAWRAGLLGNIGSALTGLNEAYRENQRRNERALLAASGVFGTTNGLLNDWLGINQVDPDTHEVVSGPKKGKYNYGDNKYYDRPQLATNGIVAAKGGKLNRKSKKRKGFTF